MIQLEGKEDDPPLYAEVHHPNPVYNSLQETLGETNDIHAVESTKITMERCCLPRRDML